MPEASLELRSFCLQGQRSYCITWLTLLLERHSILKKVLVLLCSTQVRTFRKCYITFLESYLGWLRRETGKLNTLQRRMAEAVSSDQSTGNIRIGWRNWVCLHRREGCYMVTIHEYSKTAIGKSDKNSSACPSKAGLGGRERIAATRISTWCKGENFLRMGATQK